MLFYNSLIQRSTKQTSRSSLSVAILTLMLITMSFYVSFFWIGRYRALCLLKIVDKVTNDDEAIHNSIVRRHHQLFSK